MDRAEFTEADRQQIASLGISEDQVRRQIAIFQQPSFFLTLARPCTPGDGIRLIAPDEMGKYLNLHHEAADAGRFCKFVPASGAATRMFQVMHQVYQAYDQDLAAIRGKAQEGEATARDFLWFLENFQAFPFYFDLKAVMAQEGHDLDELLRGGRFKLILEYLLDDRGLNYGALPKGLLKFHCYFTGCRTPVEEHLIEAAHYVKDCHGVCRLHFTISPEHEARFRQLLAEIIPQCEPEYQATYEIGFSHQKRRTDTIAVDHEDCPFRDAHGCLLFRPGGHGALLENLHDLQADLVYIKNIDNIAPDHLKEPTFLWKRILGGYLVDLQMQIHHHLRRLRRSGEPGDLQEAMAFCRDIPALNPPEPIDSWSPTAQRDYLFQKLHRPIRVCGMVPNVGEPGGGPHWVMGADGSLSCQIVEQAQVNLDNPGQAAIWKAATHFNPVDLVCAVRDDQGNCYDLPQYIDPQAVFISQKSKDGRVLKALELPGLWNGAMADWISVFVEIPGSTFSPVKTVADLLRAEHQPES